MYGNQNTSNTSLKEDDSILFQTKKNDEYEEIRNKYINTDQWMKAPNGKPTNLTEEQWIEVRTPSFKKWFNDWEKSARIRRWLNSNDIIHLDSNAYVGKYNLNWKDAGVYGRTNLRGVYTIQDTNRHVVLTRKGIDEIVSHNISSESGLKLLAHLPELIKKAVYITSADNSKSKNRFSSFEYYLTDVEMDGKRYVVKSDIGVREESGRTYYVYNATEIINKGALMQAVSSMQEGRPLDASSSVSKDTRLLSILQVDSSKVVDANAEPMPVYHCTEKQFTIFDKNKIGSSVGAYHGYGFNFAPYPNSQHGRIGMSVYLNIRNPLSHTAHNIKLKDAIEIIKAVDVERHEDMWNSILWNYINPEFSAKASQREMEAFYDKAVRNVAKQLLDYAGNDADFYAQLSASGSGDANEFIKVFESFGYDGVTHDDGVIIAFEPNQIKSATDNIGRFDSDNPSILFQSDIEDGEAIEDYDDPYWDSINEKLADGMVDSLLDDEIEDMKHHASQCFSYYLPPVFSIVGSMNSAF